MGYRSLRARTGASRLLAGQVGRTVGIDPWSLSFRHQVIRSMLTPWPVNAIGTSVPFGTTDSTASRSLRRLAEPDNQRLTRPGGMEPINASVANQPSSRIRKDRMAEVSQCRLG